jgi:hypothetical protein
MAKTASKSTRKPWSGNTDRGKNGCKRMVVFGGRRFSVFGFQFSVFSFQFSVFSFQFSGGGVFSLGDRREWPRWSGWGGWNGVQRGGDDGGDDGGGLGPDWRVDQRL